MVTFKNVVTLRLPFNRMHLTENSESSNYLSVEMWRS